ncbi:NADH-quinone oxidoreductase subunit C [uncultured Alistipes sp.]|uniref:hydrogenase large subunit n=1 Tax=uncultured Alistipes sp. TaxID=538949 RepID=UPI0025FBBF11|nr:NADH-quinone oxidoreductase subunit C [uncultured Alistipes sp.]
MRYFITDNRAGSVRLDEIPEVTYAEFYTDLAEKLTDTRFHLAHYFSLPVGERMRFFCLLLDDSTSQVLVSSHVMEYYDELALPSLTALHPQVHPFERDITERFGVRFDNMPWDKPLRFPADSLNTNSLNTNYPFYAMRGGSLHEVNVGPIHAGIIEPGAFRFICNGEEVFHLEIALGYQHRGIEHALASTGNRLRQVCLAETIAGDNAIAHATAFAAAVEKLAGAKVSRQLELERAVALELERMAMQIADTGALCMDVAYQLGQVACEALRTTVINTMQAWCGNRFGKGLIRPAGSNHPLTEEKAAMIRRNVAEVARRYDEIRHDIKSSPTLLARFEQCGTVQRDEMLRIGGVGQAARASGAARDIRTSHPWGIYGEQIQHESITKEQGDVMSRLMVRSREVLQSAGYIEELLAGYTPHPVSAPDYTAPLAPDSLAFGLIEGWRGETCHVVLTDAEGRIAACRVKDPSLHNWLALALAVRGEGISDFPICNKSFNLSYCGHDL